MNFRLSVVLAGLYYVNLAYPLKSELYIERSYGAPASSRLTYRPGYIARAGWKPALHIGSISIVYAFFWVYVTATG